MSYRRNIDENLQQLKRKHQITRDPQDFLRYRYALARTGHRDIITPRRGLFRASSSGDIVYVKARGPNTLTYVIIIHMNDFHDLEKLQKSTGHRIIYSSNIILPNADVFIPPEVIDHLNSIRINYYRQEVAKLESDSGMAVYAMTQRPVYQETLYRLMTSELENLGYFQEHPLDKVFCSQYCGREMGINVPARALNRMCFYCWKKMFNFDQKWLDDQLKHHGGHSPQFQKNLHRWK